MVKLGHLEAGRPHHLCRKRHGHLDSPASSTSSVLTFNIYIIRFITVTVNNITSINSTNKISYQQHLPHHDQVRKDERMGLAKAPPGDGDPTHLRFASLLFFWKSVFCFWHTVQNHCFQDPKVETRGRRFVHNSTLQSHALMSGRFSSGISFTDLLKEILWSVGMMIVVGGVCLPRQMSRGFGNNQTEEWMFRPPGFSDKREYTFISKNRSSWWF